MERVNDLMFRHVMEISRSRFKTVLILTAEADVIVIVLYSFYDLHFDQLWIEFGAADSKNRFPSTYKRD